MATAAWVAPTMHGYWWSGRQVVVVLPLAAILVLAGLAERGRLTWVFGREQLSGAPLWRLAQPLWSDYQVLSAPGHHLGQLAGHQRELTHAHVVPDHAA